MSSIDIPGVRKMMAKLYVGIDPGLSGAIAWCYPASDVQRDSIYSSEMYVVDTPNRYNTNGKRIVDMGEMCTILNRFSLSPVSCYLEKASPAPLMPAVSAFTYGEGYGAWKMGLTRRGIKITEVMSQTWKRFFFRGQKFPDKKDSKKASIALAKAFYPYLDFGNRADAGRAEAVLICRYGMRIEEGTVEE